MRKLIFPALLGLISSIAVAQQNLTPETLLSLSRLGDASLNSDHTRVLYKVSTPNLPENRLDAKWYSLPLAGGVAAEASAPAGDDKISPDGQHFIRSQEVKIKQVLGPDVYTDAAKSTAQIYDNLNYRHWDEWEDGSFGHLFVGTGSTLKDIMPGEPYDCPQKPFGGAEDYTWSQDSKSIVYVCKKKFGTAYATSTNTDLYRYDLATGATVNLTEAFHGYDTQPAYSIEGKLAWLNMRREGYESDKNDIMVLDGNTSVNLTKDWDGTVNSFLWSADGHHIYFVAPIDGTIQMFEVSYPGAPTIRQITHGEFDVSDLVGQAGNIMVVKRTDFNHAAELYKVDLSSGKIEQLSHINDEAYSHIAPSKVERRQVTTTDGKQMLVWVLLPPNFDATKKYPTLLYCEGGPQTPLSQFYSFRWNLSLMASAGYIIVAPNRRGMPGHGVAWNEQISKDHGGQAINDYLSAIDAVSKEKYVDTQRLGCVGASYGGYSVFFLAGVHENRFKTFIAHDGIFDLKSMYGTTEELWFVNWDLGGAYWDSSNAAAQKTYREFDPMSKVAKWTAPILIFQGGKDYRVPLGQGLEAFQAAQLRGLKSKLIVFPDENHWVLHVQNSLVWHREFFKWLRETL